MGGQRGEAPLFPPYGFHSPNKAMALTFGGRSLFETAPNSVSLGARVDRLRRCSICTASSVNALLRSTCRSIPGRSRLTSPLRGETAR